jgi:hypothetical protein
MTLLGVLLIRMWLQARPRPNTLGAYELELANISQLQQCVYVFSRQLHSIDEHEDKKKCEIYQSY